MVSKVLVANFQAGEGCWVAQCIPQPAPARSPGKGAVGVCANGSASLFSVPCHLLLRGPLHLPPFEWTCTFRLQNEVGVTLRWSP